MQGRGRYARRGKAASACMSPAARWRASVAMGVPIRALPRREPRCHRRITGPILPPSKWVAPPNSDKVLEGFCPEPHSEEQIVVNSNGLMFFLRLVDMEWLETAGNYVSLHVGKETYMLRETLAARSRQAARRPILAHHPPTLVNSSQIKELQPVCRGKCGVLLHNGTRLAVMCTCCEELRQIGSGIAAATKPSVCSRSSTGETARN